MSHIRMDKLKNINLNISTSLAKPQQLHIRSEEKKQQQQQSVYHWPSTTITRLHKCLHLWTKLENNKKLCIAQRIEFLHWLRRTQFHWPSFKGKRFIKTCWNIAIFNWQWTRISPSNLIVIWKCINIELKAAISFNCKTFEWFRHIRRTIGEILQIKLLVCEHFMFVSLTAKFIGRKWNMQSF